MTGCNNSIRWLFYIGLKLWESPVNCCVIRPPRPSPDKGFKGLKVLSLIPHNYDYKHNILSLSLRGFPTNMFEKVGVCRFSLFSSNNFTFIAKNINLQNILRNTIIIIMYITEKNYYSVVE